MSETEAKNKNVFDGANHTYTFEGCIVVISNAVFALTSTAIIIVGENTFKIALQSDFRRVFMIQDILLFYSKTSILALDIKKLDDIEDLELVEVENPTKYLIRSITDVGINKCIITTNSVIIHADYFIFRKKVSDSRTILFHNMETYYLRVPGADVSALDDCFCSCFNVKDRTIIYIDLNHCVFVFTLDGKLLKKYECKQDFDTIWFCMYRMQFIISNTIYNPAEDNYSILFYKLDSNYNATLLPSKFKSTFNENITGQNKIVSIWEPVSETISLMRI